MSEQTEQFEPVIIGFTCNWCSYRAADLAGTARVKYPPNVRLIRLMCSGRLDPTFVLKALAGGADAVLITGCHPGECHYLEQNYKAMRRFRLLQRTLAQLGVEPGRVRLVWASAAEGVRLAHEIARMVEEVRALGPLNWFGSPARRRPSWITEAVVDAELDAAEVEAEAEAEVGA
ncbi:MAG: hydrogenase iron-sulfur subunit [Gemmatimonadales bacterium]|jgi:F420-non-reducing hydrogenase iron-sulfur subunit|nr:hydrogenase iron-sulfur subunit [Gemmatimonadales bacterium]